MDDDLDRSEALIEDEEQVGLEPTSVFALAHELWLGAGSANVLLELIKPLASVRKLWLFGCVITRRICARACFPAPEIDVCERYADGLATDAEMLQAQEDFLRRTLFDHNASEAIDLLLRRDIRHQIARLVEILDRSCSGSMTLDRSLLEVLQWTREETAQCLRDLFGNPFRPVTIHPTWLTSTVVALAQGIDATCAFDRLPILADALMDAGCEESAILEHCHTATPHVRGCWLIDQLLGQHRSMPIPNPCGSKHPRL